MPTLARMLGASVISSLFVGVMFFLLLIVTSLFKSFSLEFMAIALYLSMYAVIVSLVVIVLLGIPMVIFLSIIKKLSWKDISAISFVLGFILLYLLLKGSIFSSDKLDIYSYMFCGLFGLASASTALVFLKNLKLEQVK